MTSMVKPGGQTWTYNYNADGDLARDGNGGTTSYGYDVIDRLTSISYTGSVTPNVTFSYDGDGNRTQMTDGGGTVNYSYDYDNRLTGVTRGSQSFAYGYNADSNVTSETYPDTTSIAYTYSNDDQLASVAAGGNTTSYTYDPAGNLATTTLPAPNGYTQTMTYDKAGRLTDVSNASATGVLSAFAYTLDADGNPTEVDQTGTSPSTTSYGYDTLDRLTSATTNGATSSWTYDDVGNRLTQTTPSGTTNYTYNSDDQLTSDGSNNYSYDGNGNETAAGSNAFSYDLANRLLSADVSGTTSSYGYDGDGNRLTSATAGTTTDYLWDPAAAAPQLDAEQTSSGSAIRSYLYGTGLVSMATNGSTYYYHSDGLGSTANLTDANGTPQWSYSYDPWGNATATLDVPVGPVNPIQYADGYADTTGLTHFGARQYDPTTGRFLTTDPTNRGSNTHYAYVSDEPSAAVDPTGLWGWNPFKDAEQLANAALGLRLPDYATLCFAYGFATKIAGQGCLTVDRYNNVYYTGGGGAATPGGSGSIRWGWVNTSSTPSSCELEHYIEGKSLSTSIFVPVDGVAGPGLSFGENWGNEGQYNASDTSTEAGVGLGTLGGDIAQTETKKWFTVPWP